MKQLFSTTVIVIALLLTGSLSTRAQDDDGISLQSTILERAQQVMDSYAATATLSNDQRVYDFQQLFASRNASVYNDLVGLTERQGNGMTPDKYAQTLRDPRVSNTRVDLRDISYGEPYRDPQTGGWKINVTFYKDISYNIGEELFSNSNSGNDQLRAILKYDSNLDQCLIERITRNSGPALKGSGYTKKHSNNDNPWRLRAMFGMGMGNAFTLGKPSLSASGSFDDGKSSTMGIGAEIGYRFVGTQDDSDFKLTAFTGVGISTSELKDLSFNGDYSYMTQDRDADIDGDTYTRYYNGLSIAQSVKLTELSIPLYLDAEMPFGDSFSAYADLGVRLNLNMSNSLSSEASVKEINGVYQDYNNIKFDQNFGYNGFTNSGGKLNHEKIDIGGLSGFNADLLAGLGIRFKIPSMDKLQIDLGISYMMGLNDVLAGDDVQLAGSDNKTINKPIIYNRVATTEPFANTEYVRCLTDALKSVKRKALRVNIGLVYNF